jgi:signal transduction histidine kinase
MQAFLASGVSVDSRTARPDDGRGFDPASVGYGTGLQGMADWLEAIGGTLEMQSAPGGGTTISGLVPVEVVR